MLRRISLTLLASLLVVLASVSAAPFQDDMRGAPASPQAWHPQHWDVTTVVSDFDQMYPMEADHGPNCEPPPATHHISTGTEGVYQCADHIMTAVFNGYAAVYMTPDQLLDFSNGPATLSWRMSTQRTSARDWVDVVLMPFDTNDQLNFDDRHVPRDAVHISLGGEAGGSNVFSPFIYRNFQRDPLSFSWYNMEWERFLTPSATRRDLFTVQLSRTHLRVGMPEYGKYWVDTDINPPLDWDQAVVQLNQRSYNAAKACDFDGTCGPDTWHWSDVTLAPAKPFTIIPANLNHVDERTAHIVSFPQPAPANAFLRFAGDHTIEYSLDGGATWLKPIIQGPPIPSSNPEIGQQYWTPVPAGTINVMFRGFNQGSVHWGALGIALWSNGEPTTLPPTATPPSATPTPTVTPGATATPTPGTTPTATPVSPTASPTPTATPTPGTTPTAPVCSVSGTVNGITATHRVSCDVFLD